MRKFFAFITSLIVIFFLNYIFFTQDIKASGEFNSDVNVTYEVKESGITNVNNKVILTNVFSNLYATSYSIVLNSINPKNIRAYDSNGPLQVENITNESQTTINVKFSDAVVGKDKSRTFWISYDEASFAIRTGEVWEISIPRLSEEASFGSYYVNLIVPDKLGQEAYISPSPRDKFTTQGMQHYTFNKEDVSKTGIVAGFGDFQVFSFNLNYHLENPLNHQASTEIALPPDNAFQKVYYSNIQPKPQEIKIDIDGNWIATYSLKARERVDVQAQGSVQIFSSLRPFLKPSEESLQNSLKSDIFWEKDNPEIIKLAKELKTPQRIYEYVSTTLNYDFSRVQPNVERFGASKALNNKDNAICMEFTDLFIAISRASGIPAREINGFAYTENPEIQPLSLVGDVLHSWPEYYDFSKNAWIPIDPTWASTTKGVDYFSKLDLRHFAFVIHGNNSKTPYPAGSYKLGSNPQKDVYISFGELPKSRNSKIRLEAKLSGWIPLISDNLDYQIINDGPTAIYNIKPKVFFDDQEIDSNFIESILPFSTYTNSIDIPFSFLAKDTPDIVKVIVLDKDMSVKTNKKEILIYNLLFVFIVAILVLLTVLFRIKKWKISISAVKNIFSRKN